MTNADLPRAKPGPTPRAPVRARDIHGLKYFNNIKKLLKSLHSHKDCPNRDLHYDEFAALILLHFFNPVLESLRATRQATELENVQRKLGVGRTSLGSLSEASRRFDPALLREIVQELAGEAAACDGHARPTGLDKELDVIAMDGSLLDALPRMAWALWLDKEHRAVKLHVEFDVLRGVPQDVTVTNGNGNEKQVMRQVLESGKLYLIDAGYAEYRFFEDIRKAKSSFIGRLRDNAVYEIIEERPLTETDREAGVGFDRVVHLGCEAKRMDLSGPVRVIQVELESPPERGLARRASKVSSKKTFRHRPQEYVLLLATDRMDLPAEIIALLYRFRWTIELFFRWLKTVLRLRHLLFESPRGVEILVYCALIATLLVVLWTGRKPTRRTLEMIQLYFQGWAQLHELEAHFQGLKKSVK